MGGQGGAQRPTGIPRRRLYPDVVEVAVAQDFAVGDAVQRHAAGEAEVGNAGFGGQGAGQTQHRLVEHHLDRGRQVHVALADPGLRVPRRAAE